ncbi:MAG: AI-2E family transporter [Candidatus Melainabacteria bacterium]|nr:AI-2E family transporter [Candidatus Melainabacteria bacterium]
MSSETAEKLALIKKAITIVLVTVLLLWAAVKVQSLLICTFMAIILASAIAPAAEILETRKVPRTVTVIGIYILIAIVYVVLAISLIPVIKEQAQQLFSVIPQYLNQILESVDKAQHIAGNYAGADAVNNMDYATMAKDLGTKALGKTINFTQDVFEAILNGIFILFLTSYFVIEADKMWPQLLLWLPEYRREKAASLIRPLEVRLGGYVRGQVLVSVAVSLILGTGLTLLQVKYSLILGLIAGLMNIVPFVGSIITCVFSIVVAANQSPMLGLATFGLFAFEQWLESNFIVPHLIGKNVDLHPLIVLFSLLIGGTLFGLPGAVIAVPLASAILFLAREFYFKSINPDLNADLSPTGEP